MTIPFSRPLAPYLSRPVQTIAADATIEATASRLRELSISSLLVVTRDGEAAGVISRTDLLRGSGRVAGERMSQPVVTALANDSVAAAARIMWARRIHRVYVLDAGRPTGVFTTREVMLAVRDEKIQTPLSAVMSTPVITIEVDRPVHEATALLVTGAIGGVVVVENDHPVGLYTQSEALAAAALPPGTLVDEVMSAALMCLRTTIPAHRAAAFAVSTRARRIVAIHHHDMKGVVSGMDFVRLAASQHEPERGLAVGSAG